MQLYRRFLNKFSGRNKKLQVKLYEGLNIGPGTPWSIANLDGLVPQLITIGEDCRITPKVMIPTHDASLFNHTGRYRVAPVKIGARVYIGYGAITMPGVIIGEDAIVGAGAVVTHDVPSNTVVVGVPARRLCSTTELIERNRDGLTELPESFAHQVGHALPMTLNDVLQCQQHLLRLVNSEQTK
jgi:maltose O-acetyltransferase